MEAQLNTIVEHGIAGAMHTINRIKQRYGITVTLKDIALMMQHIQDQNYVIVNVQDNRRRIVIVNHYGNPIMLVYQAGEGRGKTGGKPAIVTALPIFDKVKQEFGIDDYYYSYDEWKRDVRNSHRAHSILGMKK